MSELEFGQRVVTAGRYLAGLPPQPRSVKHNDVVIHTSAMTAENIWIQIGTLDTVKMRVGPLRLGLRSANSTPHHSWLGVGR